MHNTLATLGVIFSGLSVLSPAMCTSLPLVKELMYSPVFPDYNGCHLQIVHGHPPGDYVRGDSVTLEYAFYDLIRLGYSYDVLYDVRYYFTGNIHEVESLCGAEFAQIITKLNADFATQVGEWDDRSNED